MRRPVVPSALLVLLSGPWVFAGTAPRALADRVKSIYAVYHDAQAPASVKLAALELSRVIAESTGATLPVQTSPASPMICLGVNETSRAAGLDKDLPDVGFRLVTRGNDIFILGKTATVNQRKRLELLGENLVAANFHLRKAHLLAEDEARKSPLYRGDKELLQFVKEKQDGLGIINVAEWVPRYGYSEMPVLKEGWRPK